jgi:EXLDI family protein
MITPMTERHKYTVTDHQRSIVFTGMLLGHASSAEENKTRWTEMTIYLTEAGQYVVAGVGQSSVKKGDWIKDSTGRSVQALEDETPRAWSHVCDTPEGAIAVLYQKDSTGVRYMTDVARAALESAIIHNAALADAFLVEEIA